MGGWGRAHNYSTFRLIVLEFNDTSTQVGHFVSSPEKGRKEIEEIVEGNLGIPIGTIIAISVLQVSPILSIKFLVN